MLMLCTLWTACLLSGAAARGFPGARFLLCPLPGADQAISLSIHEKQDGKPFHITTRGNIHSNLQQSLHLPRCYRDNLSSAAGLNGRASPSKLLTPQERPRIIYLQGATWNQTTHLLRERPRGTTPPQGAPQDNINTPSPGASQVSDLPRVRPRSYSPRGSPTPQSRTRLNFHSPSVTSDKSASSHESLVDPSSSSAGHLQHSLHLVEYCSGSGQSA